MIRRAFIAAVFASVAAFVVAPERAHADVAACIAANDQGLEQRKAGHLRDALTRLTACTDPACPEEVRAECNARITEIQAVLPRLLLIVNDARGGEVAAEIQLDGAAVRGFLGTPTAIDPGTHVLRVSAPGLMAVDRTIVMRAGESQRRELVVLSPPSFWTTQRVLGVSAAGAGLVGLVLGGVFTGFAASAKSQESSDCSASSCPNRPQGVADYNAAVSNATGAEVGFIAGGVLAAAGVVLFLTARTPLSSTVAPITGGTLTLTPWVSTAREGSGVMLRGSF